MELNGQIAIITGGASGLGEATAKYLNQSGVKVAILDANPAAIKKIPTTKNFCAIVCDVTDEASVKNALAEINNQLGSVRILINCAGIAPAARMINREGAIMPLTEFINAININLVGTFNVMRLAAQVMTTLPPLSNGERGVIINTASVAAFDGQIGQTAYSASKGAIAAMTLPAARELAQWGIRVMTIAPGVMATPMLMGLPEKIRTELENNIPFPHRLGHAEEYAALVKHIIENTYLNGEVIRLDGALRMPPK